MSALQIKTYYRIRTSYDSHAIGHFKANDPSWASSPNPPPTPRPYQHAIAVHYLYDENHQHIEITSKSESNMLSSEEAAGEGLPREPMVRLTDDKTVRYAARRDIVTYGLFRDVHAEARQALEQKIQTLTPGYSIAWIDAQYRDQETEEATEKSLVEQGATEAKRLDSIIGSFSEAHLHGEASSSQESPNATQSESQSSVESKISPRKRKASASMEDSDSEDERARLRPKSRNSRPVRIIHSEDTEEESQDSTDEDITPTTRLAKPTTPKPASTPFTPSSSQLKSAPEPKPSPAPKRETVARIPADRTGKKFKWDDASRITQCQIFAHYDFDPSSKPTEDWMLVTPIINEVWKDKINDSKWKNKPMDIAWVKSFRGQFREKNRGDTPPERFARVEAEVTAQVKSEEYRGLLRRVDEVVTRLGLGGRRLPVGVVRGVDFGKKGVGAGVGKRRKMGE